ncbi:MAG: phosphotransacetylase family protein [Microcoleaceae cyanobacterium]
MAKSAKYLLIGSTEPYSGKSTIALGIANQLQPQGIKLAYSKPLGIGQQQTDSDFQDSDSVFVSRILGLSEAQVQPPVLMLTPESVDRRVSGQDSTNYLQLLQDNLQQFDTDLVLLEGPGTLQEGCLFNLSLPQIAQTLSASVILVEHLQPSCTVDQLIFAKQQLGDRLMGVVINDFTLSQQPFLDNVTEFIEKKGIPVLGVIPRNALLRSVSVKQLVQQLQAEVMCCENHLDLMVESLSVGAMNVSAAMKYFDRSMNMAVVTGGDRTDIQLAALEKSTHCLVLTGPRPTDNIVLSRAEDVEIPILWVDRDTLTTVEIIDQAFGHTRLHQPNQVQCITQLMAERFNLDQVMGQLGLEVVTPSV